MDKILPKKGKALAWNKGIPPYLHYQKRNGVFYPGSLLKNEVGKQPQFFETKL